MRGGGGRGTATCISSRACYDDQLLFFSMLYSSLILSAALLIPSSRSSFAYDQPAHTATIVLLVSGLALLVYGRCVALFSDDGRVDEDDASIALSDSLLQPSSEWSSRALEKLHKVTSEKIRKTWVIIALAVSVLSLRVELFREIVTNSECSNPAVATSLPLVLSVYESWSSRKNKVDETEDLNGLKRSLASIPPAALLLVAGLLTASLDDGWRSTYICPTASNKHLTVVLLQCFTVLVDAAIMVTAGKLARSSFQRSGGRKQVTTLWGLLMIGAAVIWMLVGCVIFIVSKPYRAWYFSSSSLHMASVLKQCFLFTLLVISASEIVPKLGVLGLSFLLSFTFITVSQVSHLISGIPLFPNISIFRAILSILLLHAAGYWYLRSHVASDTSRKLLNPRGLLRLIIYSTLAASLALVMAQQKEAGYHPIDVLMSEAKAQHEGWLGEASHSSNLLEAVEEYRRRYKQHPPPGFDIWYEFATNKSALIIDDYDQIYNDLLPFRAMAPKELRDLTGIMVTDAANDNAAILVRNGVAELQEDIRPTHRWMVEGTARIINTFAQYLPDMDLALNLNDEARVAVPWSVVDALRSSAMAQPLRPDNELSDNWSENRASTWPPTTRDHLSSHPTFIGVSFQHIFDGVVRPLCPPSSMAQSMNFWDHRSLCVECAKPHSLDQFLQNWTLAGDICHQPDLANLHGFYLSPSALSLSQKLLPVFSQSKAPGFNDILYPSAWNYIDKVKYEPSDEHPDEPFSKKDPALFWRGSTSEGFSGEGEWRGMTRQRLVNLGHDRSSKPISVLLPSAKKGSFIYKTLATSEIRTSLNLKTSIDIAEKPIRCDPPDCQAEVAQFGTVGRSDFQEHWKYKYLFDADGAGYSGRFLSFLQSHSLPFRTALFQTWMDSRITPWVHFVPIDLRLHAVWSTLAYFAGAKTVDKKDNDKVLKVLMEPNDKAGEFIAEEGRAWAEKALRKEDMEIYMFRLLLEWGRLTDDRRDELGFKP